MPSFRRPENQAAHAVKQMLYGRKYRWSYASNPKLYESELARNYLETLTKLTEWLQTNRLSDLKGLTQEIALRYLEHRRQLIGQKLLDREQQVIQLHLSTQLACSKFLTKKNILMAASTASVKMS